MIRPLFAATLSEQIRLAWANSEGGDEKASRLSPCNHAKSSSSLTSFSVIVARSFSLFLSFARSLALSLSLSLSLSFARSLSLYLSFARLLSLYLSFTRSLFLSLYLSLARSLARSLSLFRLFARSLSAITSTIPTSFSLCEDRGRVAMGRLNGCSAGNLKNRRERNRERERIGYLSMVRYIIKRSNCPFKTFHCSENERKGPGGFFHVIPLEKKQEIEIKFCSDYFQLYSDIVEILNPSLVIYPSRKSICYYKIIRQSQSFKKITSFLCKIHRWRNYLFSIVNNLFDRIFIVKYRHLLGVVFSRSIIDLYKF